MLNEWSKDLNEWLNEWCARYYTIAKYTCTHTHTNTNTQRPQAADVAALKEQAKNRLGLRIVHHSNANHTTPLSLIQAASAPRHQYKTAQSSGTCERHTKIESAIFQRVCIPH